MPVDIARWTAAGLPDHVTPDDLAPAAWEGLYDAAATWRPNLGPFKPWARVRIRAAVIADRPRNPRLQPWGTVNHGLYWRGQTAAAIAAHLGVTASRVSQIHAESVAMIRDALDWHLDQQPGPALSARSARRRDAYRHAVAHAHDLHRD